MPQIRSYKKNQSKKNKKKKIFLIWTKKHEIKFKIIVCKFKITHDTPTQMLNIKKQIIRNS